MTLCIQCALETFVRSGGEDYGQPTDETPEQHMARVHPGGVDPTARRDLEQQAARLLEARLGRILASRPDGQEDVP